MKSVIEYIQDDDPSYDPLEQALKKTPFVGRKLWQAACDRVYYDGYYGPLSNDDWKEQDGRKPYSVREAIEIIKRVLDNIQGYRGDEYIVNSSDIKEALIPWYKEIYGVRYPS